MEVEHGLLVFRFDTATQSPREMAAQFVDGLLGRPLHRRRELDSGGAMDNS